MKIDWDYLNRIADDSDDWKGEELEEIFQNLSGITKFKQREKTVDRLEMLFTLTQAVMIAKYNQVKSLEKEINTVSESAGQLDEEREQQLLYQIQQLQQIVEKHESKQSSDDSGNFPYDWSSGWKKKQKKLQDAVVQKNAEIEQLIGNLQKISQEKSLMVDCINELESKLNAANGELNKISSDYIRQTEQLKIYDGKFVSVKDKMYALETHLQETRDEKTTDKENYEYLLREVDSRVEKIKTALESKEQELIILKNKNDKDDTTTTSSDDVIGIRNDLHEKFKAKETEIELLTEKLSQAARELNLQVDVISSLKGRKRSVGGVDELLELRSEIDQRNGEIERLQKQLLLAEEDAQLHAQDLTTVLSELQAYMAGEYSLADSIAKLKDSRIQVEFKNSHIQKLTAELNELQIDYQDILEENSVLREQMQLQPRKSAELAVTRLDEKTTMKQIKKESAQMKEERLKLKQKIFMLTNEIAELKIGEHAAPLTESKGPSITALKEEMVNLRHAVFQLARTKSEQPPEEVQLYKEKCLRLEGEKHALKTALEKAFAYSKDSSQNKDVETKIKKSLEKLPQSVAQTLAKLKNQVEYLTQEMVEKEGSLKEGENNLSIYRDNFSSLHEQVQLLNNQLNIEKEKCQGQIDIQGNRVITLEAEISAFVAKNEEMNLVMGSDGGDIDKLRTRCTEWRYELELSRRMCSVHKKEIEMLYYRIDETTDGRTDARKQLKELQNETRKEMERRTDKEDKLKSKMASSVPRSLLERIDLELATMTAKYRSLLDKQTFAESTVSKLHVLEKVCQDHVTEKETLLDQLVEEKEKIHSLQVSLSYVTTSPDMKVDMQVCALSKQLALVERQELEARQRSHHASAMYELLQGENNKLIERIKMLERSHNEVLQVNSTLQETEIKLRNQLVQSACPPEKSFLSEMDCIRNEKESLAGEVEDQKYKLQILQKELKNCEIRCRGAEEEVTLWKSRDEALVSLSDDKARIAALYLELKHEKQTCQELKQLLNDEKVKCVEMSLQQNRIDIKFKESEYISQNKWILSNARCEKLLNIVRDLRIQFTGAVPLHRQERLVALIEELQEERHSLSVDAQAARQDRHKARLLLGEMKVKNDELEELRNTFATKDFLQQAVLCSKRAEEMCLANVKLKEHIMCLEEENDIDNSRLRAKDKRVEQLQQHVVSLERLLAEQNGFFELAENINNSTTEVSFANISSPVTSGRSVILKESSKLQEYVDLQTEVASHLQTLKQERDNLRSMEERLAEKELLIIEQTSQIAILTKGKMQADSSIDHRDVTENSLKDRVKMLEGTVERFKKMFQQSQAELDKHTASHRLTVGKLILENKNSERIIDELQIQLDSIPTNQTACQVCSIHLLHIENLEKSLKSSRLNLVEVNKDLENKHNQILTLERDLAILKREKASEKEQLEISGEIKTQQMQREIRRLAEEVKRCKEEKDIAKKQVCEIQQSALRTPSIILKTLIEKLRDQLIEKDKQISSLTAVSEELKQRLQETSSKFDGEIPVKECQEENLIKNKLIQIEQKVARFENEDGLLIDKIKKRDDDIERLKKSQSVEMTEAINETQSGKNHIVRLEKQYFSQKKLNEELRSHIDSLTGKDIVSISKSIEILKAKLTKLNGLDTLKKSEERQSQIEESTYKWEEKKKFQQANEKLKNRLLESERGQHCLTGRLETSKDIVKKLERDKYSLMSKITRLNKLIEEPICRICLKSVKNSEAEQLRMDHTFTKEEIKSVKEDSDSNDVLDQTYTIVAKNSEELARKEKELARLREDVGNYVKLKDLLERKLSSAKEEISALRKRLDKLQIKCDVFIKSKKMAADAKPGTALVLDYEQKISELEEQLREKNRLLEHIKKVLEDAASREEDLKKQRENLLQKVIILESVSSDTPHEVLVVELRKAKMTVNRLQRIIDHKH